MTGFDEAEKVARLQLIRTENIGPITFLQLIQRFGNARAALAHLPDLARRGGRRQGLSIASAAAARRELEEIGAVRAVSLFRGEPHYPKLLAMLDDAPPMITVQGHPVLLEKRAVAIVGARNASSNGQTFAKRLAQQLGEAGIVVVSGLARGIDAAAHQGALTGGTIGVVAGGIDIVYPPQHKELQAAIGEQGLLVAEMPLGTQPQARHFPRRNRLISGLSLGVVVVEAAEQSGSLITARLAGEQGRDVFAVPGSPLDPRCRGTNGLLRDGAILVESADDVVNNLRDTHAFEAEDLPLFATPVALPPLSDKEWQEAQAMTLELLGPTPVAVDEMVRQCQLSVAVLLAIMLELELAGRLERHPGNRVSLRF